MKTSSRSDASGPDCFGRQRAMHSERLSDLLFASPPEWAEKAMLGSRGEDAVWVWLTRAEVQIRVRRAARWLSSLGIRHGDRVGLLGHNSIEWCIADFAILHIGAVTVPAY
ncbi:MAG: AMP-binding protein, partial [Mariprofundaceae bacterium]|nr:AMP-binding protein [Mariprofundaceae bacterium]